MKDKKDYLINSDEPEVIQNKMWFDDEGDLYLRGAKIETTDLLRFMTFLIANCEFPDEILSECFPLDCVKDYATNKLGMYTERDWSMKND